MQFDNSVPVEIGDEAIYYVEHITVDSGGVDMRYCGDTYSASFADQDLVDVALSVLHEDFDTATADLVALIGRMGGASVDWLERQGYAYLRASQILRQAEDAAEVKSVELVA